VTSCQRLQIPLPNPFTMLKLFTFSPILPSEKALELHHCPLVLPSTRRPSFISLNSLQLTSSLIRVEQDKARGFVRAW